MGQKLFARSAMLAMLAVLLSATFTHAAGLPTISFGVAEAGQPDQVATSMKILMVLTVLSLAPALLIMVTSFARIVIVLSFLRQALGTQQVPPNQMMIGLSLFLTFFVMAPTFTKINDEALQPYMSNQINQDVALDRGLAPLRKFMLRQTREKDLGLFVNLAHLPRPKTLVDVPTYVIIPAFIISELRTAFQIGFMIYIPFLVVDMVIASVLMSMGMMMLPPVMISLPFKLMLFVLVDGWYLIVGSLVKSFN